MGNSGNKQELPTIPNAQARPFFALIHGCDLGRWDRLEVILAIFQSRAGKLCLEHVELPVISELVRIVQGQKIGVQIKKSLLPVNHQSFPKAAEARASNEITSNEEGAYG